MLNRVEIAGTDVTDVKNFGVRLNCQILVNKIEEKREAPKCLRFAQEESVIRRPLCFQQVRRFKRQRRMTRSFCASFIQSVASGHLYCFSRCQVYEDITIYSLIFSALLLILCSLLMPHPVIIPTFRRCNLSPSLQIQSDMPPILTKAVAR